MEKEVEEKEEESQSLLAVPKQQAKKSIFKNKDYIALRTEN